MADGNRWMLSGGLASGKSHVRKRFASLGVHTVDADAIGHQVLETVQAFEAVAQRWPEAVSEDVVDRSRLASIVFNDPVALAELESITHPMIFGTIEGSVEGIQDLVVVELPVLKSLGPEWSRMVVDVEYETQLERAVSRGMDRADAMSRLGLQPSREQWLAAADVVLPNHGSLGDLDLVADTVLSALST